MEVLFVPVKYFFVHLGLMMQIFYELKEVQTVTMYVL